MYQKLVIVGNLGRDPEMRYTPTGTAVTSFPVATSRRYTDASGQMREETAWFRVSTWGKQAEACNQYLAKGRKVLVEGELVIDEKTGGPRVYTRKDGTSGASFEVRGTTIRFLTPKSEGDANASGIPHAGEQNIDPAATGMSEEELPF